jgi:acetyl esterase/lipase
MVYGVNHVLDLIHEGVRVDYDIYTEDEKMVDEERKETKLFYFPGKEGNPFVMLCAGGGFTSCCSLVESFPVAAKLNELGYNVFVLSYRIEYPVCEDKWQAQINACQDVAAALEFINEHADAFKVSTKDYAIGGFSAGAMVVSQWGTDSNGYAKFGMDKPACVFLAYGGSAAKDEMSSKYPAAYVVYCKDDATVSPDGMAEMAARLKELGVPCEENAGAEGGHGFGLGLDTDVEGWVEEAVDFWQGQKG